MEVHPKDRDMLEHLKAFQARQKAELKSTVVTLTAKPVDQKKVQDAREGVNKATAALTAAAVKAFDLQLPKGHTQAPHAVNPRQAVLPKLERGKADVAATAVLPNSLWARVRNFLRAPF